MQLRRGGVAAPLQRGDQTHQAVSQRQKHCVLYAEFFRPLKPVHQLAWHLAPALAGHATHCGAQSGRGTQRQASQGHVCHSAHGGSHHCASAQFAPGILQRLRVKQINLPAPAGPGLERHLGLAAAKPVHTEHSLNTLLRDSGKLIAELLQSPFTAARARQRLTRHG